MSCYSVTKNGIYYRFTAGRLADVAHADRAAYQAENSWSEFRTDRLLTEGASALGATRLIPGQTKAPAGSDLYECLLGCTVDTLKQMARVARVDLLSATRKADIVKVLAHELRTATARLAELLAVTSSGELESLKGAAEGRFISRGSARRRTWYSYDYWYSRPGPVTFPYLFSCNEDDLCVWYVPEELRPAFERVDFDVMTSDRGMRDCVARLLYSFATLGGVVRLADVYEAFQQALPNEHLGEEAFVSLAERYASESASPYDIAIFDDAKYVVHTLRNTYETSTHIDDGFCYPEAYEHSKRTRRDMPENVDDLIRRDADILPFAGTEAMLNIEAKDYIYNLPSVQAITHYFDCHVPNGEDDLLFADVAVDMLINDLLFNQRGLGHVLTDLTKRGWYLSEGGRSAPKLSNLVLNLYRELPRWDLNGWSEVGYEDMQGLPRLIGESWLAAEELQLAS